MNTGLTWYCLHNKTMYPVEDIKWHDCHATMQGTPVIRGADILDQMAADAPCTHTIPNVFCWKCQRKKGEEKITEVGLASFTWCEKCQVYHNPGECS